MDWPERLVPPPPCCDRNTGFGRDLNCGSKPGGGLGNHDAEWLDLINAGIGTVEPARCGIKSYFTIDVLAERSCDRLPLDLREIRHTLTPDEGTRLQTGSQIRTRASLQRSSHKLSIELPVARYSHGRSADLFHHDRD